jgi:hypothetical protein
VLSPIRFPSVVSPRSYGAGPMMLVATGDLAGGAVVATADVDDVRRLASHAARVAVARIG